MTQDGVTLHFMRLNPYSAYSNPSAFLPYRGYIGVPAISNINLALTNTSLHYDALFGKNTQQPVTTIKLNSFVDQLDKKNNTFYSSLALNIIDFGFRTKHVKFGFSYRLRIEEYWGFNQDLFGLIAKGNMHYVGDDNPAIPKMSININAYQEFGLGMQAEITPNIYIGVRPKILFGLANIHTKSFQASLYTNAEDYSLKLNYNIDANIACIIPIDITTDTSFNVDIDPSEFATQWQNAFKNVGTAIDLGLTYRINDMFGVSASVLDLGFIRWKTNTSHITGSINPSSNTDSEGNLLFNGLSQDDIDQIQNDPNTLQEKFAGYFPLHTTESQPYFRALSARFLVEGYFNADKNNRFTALFQGRIINKQLIPSFTIAWNGTFLNIFDLCVNYTVAKKSYTNLGVGIGLNLGVFHIYAATDNILAICQSKGVMRSLMNTNNVNIQMGVVFDWGKLKEKKLDRKGKVIVEETIPQETTANETAKGKKAAKTTKADKSVKEKKADKTTETDKTDKKSKADQTNE